MPFTPLHLGFAWPTFMLKRHKLHFMCLSFGAMIPDIEILVMMPYFDRIELARGPMHSLLGALTIDIIIVLLIAYFLVPPVGRWFKKHAKHNCHVFAGVDVTKAPKDPMWAVFSAMVGTLSHVTLDVFTHEYNPIYWPYRLDQNDNLLLFGHDPLSSMIFVIPLAVIAVIMFMLYWTKPKGN